MNKALKKIGAAGLRLFSSIGSPFDRAFLADNVPMSKQISHSNWPQYLYKLGNKEGVRILEVGSREVTGVSEARKQFEKASYVGFDYYPGPNVDIVGDVHRLSSYFEKGEQFDIIYSSAC